MNEKEDRSVEELLEEAIVKDAPPALLEKWSLRTLADAYQPRPPIEYVVYGVFALPSLNIVYGAPGSLKSMLLADLAVCVAAGQRWLTPLPSVSGKGRGVTKAPVLWLDFDNGSRRSDERFEALGKARSLPADTPVHYVSMPDPWLNASKRQHVEELSQLVKYHDARLVVIDNLGLISGGVEENASAMAEVMGNLRWLAEDTGAAVVVIHHQRKSSGKDTRKGDSLRGHSTIEASLDLALHVERCKDADTVTISATKTRGPAIMPFAAMFTYDHKPHTKELGKARFYGNTQAVMTVEARIESAVLEALADGKRLNKTDLKDAVKERLPKEGINRISGEIDALAKGGKIQEHAGKGSERFYGLTMTYGQLQAL